MKTMRVRVAAGDGVEDARRAVEDVLELLNRHFRPRGVEFVGAAEGEDDWTIALYWKDFGGIEKEEFEAVYERFKRAQKPVIHVFFKEPDEGIGEALKAFKEAFAERYGHFYCHFETLDAVRFQLAAQSLSMLPGGVGERDVLTVEDGQVRLGKEPVAKMENLSFAKLNAKRKSLVRQIAAAAAEAAGLEAEAKASPEDEDLQEVWRVARIRHHDLREELKQHDGFLFNVAVSFAKVTAEETSERTRKAWKLFQQGKVQEANKLLDWDVLKESTEQHRTLFRAQKEAFEKNLQEYLTKAKITMADDSMTMAERVDAASRAYDEAIAIAREIHWEDEKLVEVFFDYAYLVAQQNRFQLSIQLYGEALQIRRRLAEGHQEACKRNLVATLNNLALLHYNTQRLEEAEREYAEALKIGRQLAAGNPEVYEPDVATTLNNLACLHSNTQRLREAEAEYKEVLEVRRRLAARIPEAYEPDVAAALNNLAILHKNTRRLWEAETEYMEALETYRRLAAESLEAYEPDVAMTLNNLARLHHKTQQLSAAEKEYKEALETYRRLAAGSPEAYEPDVAMTLNNLANLHSDTQRLVEAEAEYKEALEIYRRLAAGSPEAYEPDVAMTMYNLGEFYEVSGRLQEALAAARDALEAYVRCAESNPLQFEKDMEDARALVKRLEEKG